MVKVKICGITNLEDAKAAVELGADAIGFVFAKSPRQIKPEVAAEIINKLGQFKNFAGVFVNAPLETVKEIAKICKLDILQFHGDEAPEYCKAFRKTHKVFKAFRIKDKNSLKLLRKYDVDGYLLDTFSSRLRGGTGKTFDWALAKEAGKLVSLIILSGGLNQENIKEAIKKVRPYMADVSSGVEKRPGKKDLRLMKEFIKAVKNEQATG